MNSKFEISKRELHAKLLSGERRSSWPSKSRMQFKNTSDVTLQTDTNQHDTRGELHAKLRNDGHLSANHAPPAWRASEDRRRGRGAGGRRQGLAGQRVDAPSEARGADGSRAGRRPRAHQAARPHNRVLHRPEHQRRHQHRRNTSGATHHRGIAKPPGPAGAGRLTQYQRIIEESRQYRDYRDRFPGVRSRYRASRRCPWRCLPSGDPRRRR